jgi:6-phosphogluconolactonase
MPSQSASPGLIQVYPDGESLHNGAASLFVREAAKAIQARNRFTVVLSGGHTPRHTYEVLARPPWREQVDWARVHVFWGDERCVPPDDLRNNARMAREALLDHVPIPAAQIHPIPCEPSAGEGARAYESSLRLHFSNQSPRPDLFFLGLGEEGHTASLFPRDSALREKERWVVEVKGAGEDVSRVTWTIPWINQARRVVFLVLGRGKAAILKEVLEGPLDPERWPAQAILPVQGELRWLVDQEAASLLSSKGKGRIRRSLSKGKSRRR